MTRISKKSERRAISPRRPRVSSVKTGSKKDKLSHGYKPVENGVQGSQSVFIGKIK